MAQPASDAHTDPGTSRDEGCAGAALFSRERLAKLMTDEGFADTAIEFLRAPLPEARRLAREVADDVGIHGYRDGQSELLAHELRRFSNLARSAEA